MATKLRVELSAKLLEGVNHVLLPNFQGNERTTDNLVNHGVVVRENTFVEVEELFSLSPFQVERLDSRNFEALIKDLVDYFARLATLKNVGLY